MYCTPPRQCHCSYEMTVNYGFDRDFNLQSTTPWRNIPRQHDFQINNTDFNTVKKNEKSLPTLKHNYDSPGKPASVAVITSCCLRLCSTNI